MTPSPPLVPSRQNRSLLRETIGAIAVLTLNRPQARNSSPKRCWRRSAMHSPRLPRTTPCARSCSRPTARRFRAGHDLKELTARRSDADGGRAYFRLIMDLQRDDAADRRACRSR